MGRKYNFSSVNSTEKPRVVAKQRTFGEHTYAYECKGRTSVGYGYTPEHAYRQWERNWKRRFAHYRRQEEHANAVIKMHKGLGS